MNFRKDDLGNGRSRWVVELTRAESDAMVAFLRVRFAPSVERVGQMALVAAPYNHISGFMDCEVKE